MDISVPRHVAADHVPVGLLACRFMHDASVGNDQDAVGQFQDLIRDPRRREEPLLRGCGPP